MLFNNKAKGFTLTEVLLALAIVGIIAALVLPATITKLDENLLQRSYERQAQAIQSVVDVLPIKENVGNFGETSMFSTGNKTIEESSGKFLKRYMRVSKYYGDYASNAEAIKKECFASEYHEYSDGEKKTFNIDSMIHGACAKLKNGSSICLSPQINATNAIQGVIDLNGPKGPNIYQRDLRTITLSTISFENYSTKVGSGAGSVDPNGVNTTANPNLDIEEPSPCSLDDFSTDCCNYFKEKGMINDSSHGCCSNVAVASTIAQCSRNITLRLNLYPQSCNNNSDSCKVYIDSNRTTAKLNNQGSDLTVLPANPPDVLLFCSGKQVGTMSGATLAQALVKSTSSYYYFTKSNKANTTCGYQTGQGILSTKSSVVFDKKGTYEMNYNGVKWTLTYF